MTIRKATGLEGGFSIIPNETLNDGISWEALGLLAYLCSKPDDWEVSVAHLTNHSSRCNHPSGREKTYRILEELKQAGYMRKITKRVKGRFVGVDYIISPTKLAQPSDYTQTIPKQSRADPDQASLPLTDLPDTGLPDTGLPDTANPTQQSKDSYKERKNILANKFRRQILLKRKREKRTRVTYSNSFEDFFKSYPKTNGSKLEAFTAWKKLDNEEKQTVNQSVLNYKTYLKKEAWQKPMNPARYIKQEHYLSYYAPEGVLKPAESVLINGKGFDGGTLVKLCSAYFKSSEWKYNRLLGPAPDQPATLIPLAIVEQAKKDVYAGQ